ncbi:MAG: TIGR01777 family protein [Acidobacteria bacterium]|nr:TIGR01777 family protein [Acidobacteriota bacterium]
MGDIDLDRVLVSGVSGPIGAALLTYLNSQGARIVRLVRGPARGPDQISWDPLQPLDPAVVSGFEAVINLSGESVMGRWTEPKKKAIRESRVQGTTHLATALAHTPSRPRVFLCASAIGFFGNRGDEVLTEASASGQGFLPEVCREWEAASRIAADAGIRTVNIRFGLVLSPKGGALGKMVMPFKLGVGGRIGSGQQWWSWVHIDDIVGAVHHALQSQSLSGPFNMVAPNPARNVEFTEVLASILHRPAFFPVPPLALSLAFGKMAATELFLSSARAMPARLQESGYAFRFPDLRTALEELLG